MERTFLDNELSALPLYTKPINTYITWMRSIDDSVSLSDISIPGTHCSLAAYGTDEERTHSWSLTDQFKAGVRFVDYRFRLVDNKLIAHNGLKNHNAMFYDALSQTWAFLRNNPSETIIMRVSRDHVSSGNSKRYHDVIDEIIDDFLGTKPQSIIWRQNRIPTMGESRGKIILMENFLPPKIFQILSQEVYENYGILQESAQVLDEFLTWDREDLNVKYKNIEKFLNQAQKPTLEKQLYLTFCSGIGPKLSRKEISKNLNRTLGDYLNKLETGKSYGIVAMDFPDEENIRRIIFSNFKFNELGLD